MQVFVSSTYLDLKDERQKAVEGILMRIIELLRILNQINQN
ncbi:DUF4062 domain-containing protein [Lysinibacillus sp. NPDC093692]